MHLRPAEMCLVGAGMMVTAEMHLMLTEVRLVAADKLVPVEMNLMPVEVRMAASEKVIHTGRHFRLEVVHLSTAEMLQEGMHLSSKKVRLPAADTLLVRVVLGNKCAG
jgi:hypothetical protein